MIAEGRDLLESPGPEHRKEMNMIRTRKYHVEARLLAGLSRTGYRSLPHAEREIANEADPVDRASVAVAAVRVSCQEGQETEV